jgi:hypothetical protein
LFPGNSKLSVCGFGLKFLGAGAIDLSVKRRGGRGLKRNRLYNLKVKILTAVKSLLFNADISKC